MYYKELKSRDYIYLLLYVDDILIASKDKKQVCELKIILGFEFEKKDLGDSKKILGMEIVRDREKGESLSKCFLSTYPSRCFIYQDNLPVIRRYSVYHMKVIF